MPAKNLVLPRCYTIAERPPGARDAVAVHTGCRSARVPVVAVIRVRAVPVEWTPSTGSELVVARWWLCAREVENRQQSFQCLRGVYRCHLFLATLPVALVDAKVIARLIFGSRKPGSIWILSRIQYVDVFGSPKCLPTWRWRISACGAQFWADLI